MILRETRRKGMCLPQHGYATLGDRPPCPAQSTQPVLHNSDRAPKVLHHHGICLGRTRE